MADGTRKPIEEVRAGDRVKAMDPKDGQVVDREVVRTFRNVTDTVVDVTWAPLDRVECMAVGRRGRGERHSVGVARSGGESSEVGEPPSADEVQTVRCTPGHPWWAEGQQRWVLAGELRVGDQLRLEDGRLGVVLAVASRREVTRTFNFEVEGLHTYFISESARCPSTLVHNASIYRRAMEALGRARARFRMPHGFLSGEEFQRFGARLKSGLRDAGHDVTAIFQGSAVTGRKFKWPHAPFDKGRVSDFDIALASPSMLRRARGLGIELRGGGMRTGPLSAAHIESLGLTRLRDDLQRMAGREVNFMIYGSERAATSRAASIVVR